MKKISSLCVILFCSATVSFSQEIKLETILSKTFVGRVRYIYSFSLKNTTKQRMNIVGYASLLDSDKNVVDKRFISFDPRPGVTERDSIESYYGPVPSPGQPRTVVSYRLDFRDDAHHRTSVKEGDLDVPLLNADD